MFGGGLVAGPANLPGDLKRHAGAVNAGWLIEQIIVYWSGSGYWCPAIVHDGFQLHYKMRMNLA